jgi:hypothetical protein
MGIGFRVSPNEVVFTVVESTDRDEVEYYDPQTLVVPAALDGPDLLRFVRTNLLDVLNLYDVDRAVVKTADFHRSRSSNTTRTHLEGVIQEAVASSRAEAYLAGATPKLAPRLDLSSGAFKDYKNGDRQFADLPDWNDWSAAERESVLAAAVSLKIE